MKKCFFLFCGMIVLFVSACCSNDVCSRVRMERNAILIDVRTPEEFQTAHIEGAINLPYDQAESKIGGSVPEKSTPVYLYCRSGRRSSIASKKLKEMGYTSVHDLGGFQEARNKLALPEEK